MGFLEGRAPAPGVTSLLDQQDASVACQFGMAVAEFEVGHGLPGLASAASVLGVPTGLDQITAEDAIDLQGAIGAQERAAFDQAIGTGSLNRADVGAPVKAVLAVLQRWNISDELGATILGSAESGHIADLRSGAASLKTRDAQDRARLLLDIYEGVFSLLRSPEAERAWIETPRQDLDGCSVLALMTEGSQKNLLRAQAFVDYVNGR